VTITEDELTIVPDATADPRFSWKPDVAGGRGVRFYAGRPLHVDGQPVGTLCLYDTKTRDLSPVAVRRLDEMGAWAERELIDSRDLEQAATVQQALLPSKNPAAPMCAIAGLSMPLKGVGGDFYTWQRTGDSLEVTVADVMGKGVASALMAATIRSSILCIPAAAPSARLASAAEALRADLDATGIFATVFHARLDLATGALVYSDAGHGLTLLIRADGSNEQLQAGGLPLGLELGLPREDHETFLGPGETLVSFTDGLLDLYGGTQAALESIAAVISAEREPHSVVDVVRTLARGGTPEDDISVIALHRPHQP
jgi:serine phosphatase RsbU (regulator of sigma subunit)